MSRYVLIATLFISSWGLWSQSPELPEGFFHEVIEHEVSNPLGIEFDHNGQGYVFSKDGKVYIMTLNGKITSEPVLDISEEVAAYADHGLTSLALAPDFETSGDIYLAYVVDRHHLLYFGTAEYDPEVNQNSEATIGRVTRYTLDPTTNFSTLVPNSRKIILGKEITDQIPILMISHGMGSLVFGTDGTLLLSVGDAASFQSGDVGSSPETWYAQAIDDGILKPELNVGAWRAQNIDSPSGKILRFDPETGLGIPSNPWYDAEKPDSWRSKVYAMGMRNPFKFIKIPNTGSTNPDAGRPGTLIMGDVGSWQYEEFNIIHGPGENLGWPKYEGQGFSWTFRSLDTTNYLAPNPLYDGASCTQRLHSYDELVRQPKLFSPRAFPNQCNPEIEISEEYKHIHTRPQFNYANINWNNPPRTIAGSFDDNGNDISYNLEDEEAIIDGFTMAGFSCIPSFVYQGSKLPEEYQGRVIFSDFYGFIHSVVIEEEDEIFRVTKIDSFATSTPDVVTVNINPITEDIYYTRVYQDTIVRISFGTDQPPRAEIKLSTHFGESPLTIDLDASGSSHPLDLPLTYEWLLPDGSGSTEVSLQRTFTSAANGPSTQDVQLVVTDSADRSDTATATIHLDNSPPQVRITAPLDGDIYDQDDDHFYKLRAEVSDAQSLEDELTYEWQVFFHHNTHFHEEPVIRATSPVADLLPTPCNLETFWYRIRLTVTDPQGLSTIDEVEIYPNCLLDEDRSLVLSADVKNTYIDLPFELIGSSVGITQVELWRAPKDEPFKFYDALDGFSGSEGTARDNKPLFGESFYFIKGIAEDRMHLVSNVVYTEEFPNFERLTAFPNPTQGYIQIRYPDAKSELVQLTIWDLQGRSLERWTEMSEIGRMFRTTKDLAHLPSGYYILELLDGETRQQFPLILY